MCPPMSERAGDRRTVLIRPFEPEDWPAVKEIYRQGIETGNATFQPRVKEWQEWDSSTLKACRLVAIVAARVAGWAALSAVSTREVYRGVAEVSVYVAAAARGSGVGTALLSGLVEQSEREGFWTLQAVIFPENTASIALHRRCGFRVVGRREKLGKMGDRWRDVVLMERRSRIAGV